mmetsp:Transcript_168021/g.408388  ORF Transcript_168021/g.408388 Transcript_168021/m.408388 type:complete len:343 (-) Transcript_168021:1008-2036(-)
MDQVPVRDEVPHGRAPRRVVSLVLQSVHQAERDVRRDGARAVEHECVIDEADLVIVGQVEGASARGRCGDTVNEATPQCGIVIDAVVAVRAHVGLQPPVDLRVVRDALVQLASLEALRERSRRLVVEALRRCVHAESERDPVHRLGVARRSRVLARLGRLVEASLRNVQAAVLANRHRHQRHARHGRVVVQAVAESGGLRARERPSERVEQFRGVGVVEWEQVHVVTDAVHEAARLLVLHVLARHVDDGGALAVADRVELRLDLGGRRDGTDRFQRVRHRKGVRVHRRDVAIADKVGADVQLRRGVRHALVLHETGEALVEPQTVPPRHSDEVTEPLVRELV